VEKIDELKRDKEMTFTEWFDLSQRGFDEFTGASKSKIEELEKTYEDKLRFKEPADYWAQRGNAMKTQGWIAFSALLVIIILICWSLGEILWMAPDVIFTSWFGEDKSAAIRWTVVYITLISFMAFGIRSLSKVMFSSFHLARDAEERHTLTFFYLSLLKDSTVDEKDRQLIIQSLFSRSDTGLLKEDSSPTMPNDFVGKLLGSK